MPQNFNVDPYYDDFDATKNFHRILFKPGYAVQARELTQAQTILQDQITKFADNIFKQNSPVTGGQVTVNLNCNYIKLETTYNGSPITVTDFQNKTIVNALGDVIAKVVAVAEASGEEPPTLVVVYHSGSQFEDGDTLFDSESNLAASVLGSNATGEASTASISQGVFYVANSYKRADGITISNGNFVQVNPQTIILNKYSRTPNLRIGLNVNETIIDYISDPSLLDPALGASNYQAPGADRYSISLALETRRLELGDDQGFIELVRVENGNIVKMVDGSVYNVIDDYFAKRTYETNGDYVINNFTLNPAANNSDSTAYDLKIGKGIAYVHGYRLENQSELVLTNSRSRETLSKNNNIVTMDYGSYFYVDSLVGTFNTTIGAPVDFHIVPSANIVSTNTTTYNSTLVGSGYVRGLEYLQSTTNSNTASYVYKMHVFDVKTKTLSTNVAGTPTATAIQLYDTNGKFSGSANAYYGATISIDSGTGSGATRRIASYNATTKTATVDTPFNIIPTTSSNVSIRFGTKDIESAANTTVGTTTVAAKANINILGKIDGVPTNDTVFVNTQVPEPIYQIGYPYVADISDSSYSSTKILRNKAFADIGGGTIQLQVSLTGLTDIISFAGGVGTLSADAIKQNYTIINASTGAVLDFTSGTNTVSISANKNTLTLTSTSLTAPLSVNIIAKVDVVNADNSSYVLKAKTSISGNTSTVSNTGPSGIISNSYIDLNQGQVYIKNAGVASSGQQSLYVSDVKNIIKIVDSKSPTVNVTSSMLSDSSYDITNYYYFDNGQRDSYYDHASITLKPGYPKPLGDVLVIFDYYQNSGGDGYFSMKSYPAGEYATIPSYKSKNNTTYNLRDCLDFRPTRKNATSTFIFDTTANPATTDAGTLLPLDLSKFTNNYSYYLGRKDKLVLSKDKNFQIVQGTPDVYPVLPEQPDGSLLLANITHDPYTAYMPSEAPVGVTPNIYLEKIQHKRWRMSDISDLQTRLNNIEYYTTLNLLEQKASSLQIPDANGLNRFKNGILVDDFSTYGVADTINPDFSAKIDKVAKQLSPKNTVTNFTLQLPFVNSVPGKLSNVTDVVGYKIHSIDKNTNQITLPYTNVSLAEQKLASNTMNINPFNVPLFEGVMSLTPPMDNWVDNQKAPDILVVDPNVQVYQQSNTVNVLQTGNWQTIPGSTKTTTSSSSVTQNRTTTTTTTSTTTSSLSQTNLLGYWTNLGSSYQSVNNYITDISVQPYIRAQQLSVRAKGLKTNTPVKVYFDGENVTDYVRSLNVIELTNVSGTFKEDDVVGFYNTLLNQFVPYATVVSTYKYPNSSNVRLYITSDSQSNTQIFSNTSEYGYGKLSNAVFNSNGVYVSNTAFGTGTTSNIVNLHVSGYVSAVGDGFTDNTGSTKQTFVRKLMGPNQAGDFIYNYGIWSSQDGSGPLDVTYTVNFPTTGTYYFQYAFGPTAGSGPTGGKIYLDGNIIYSTTGWGISSFGQAVTAGTHTIRFTAPFTGSGAELSVAGLAVSTEPWSGGYFARTKGTIIFDTLRQPDVFPSAISPNAGTQTVVSGGGAYYKGVTKFSIASSASKITDFYVGSKIKVTSTLAGASGNRTNTFTSTITAYDQTTRMVTVYPAVDISLGAGYNSSYTIEGTQKNYIVSVTNQGVPSLSTNEYGEFSCVIDLPGGRFKTGERVVRVDNRLLDTDPGSATTYAESTFIASGLSTKSQALNFSASISSAKNTFTQTAVRQNVIVNTSTSVTSVTTPNPRDPLAQSFIIDKQSYPNGAFISSIRVFFKSKPSPKSAQLPVKLSIVPTINGYPSGETLDNSIVVLNADQIKISDTPNYLDANTYTEFAFSAPVYIQSGQLYAFILQSQSSEYNVYIAAQSATAIPSSVSTIPPSSPSYVTPTVITKIATAPYVGSLFESQNAITWVPDPTKSMMFTINRCKFQTTANPKISFTIPKGLQSRKLGTQDIERYYGEGFISNLQNVVSSANQKSHEFNITTTDFVPTNTNINYTFKSLLSATGLHDSERPIIPGKYGCPTYQNIYLDDGLGERLLATSNSETFVLYASMNSSDDTMSPIISDDGTNLYNIQWDINNLGLQNNVISITNAGSGYDSSNGNTTVTISAPDLVGGTQATANAIITAGKVTEIQITNEGSGYLNAPTINIVDANTTPGTGATVATVSEFSPNGGNAKAKYITKKVTLAEGNDSQDLRLYFTAFRPIGTEIYAFYKVQNRDDNTNFDVNNWQLMTYVNNSGNVYSISRDNLLEFELAPGVGGVANNQVTYTNSNGVTYDSFNQFSIKIVFVTNDNTKVPFLTDIRAIALPSGTGL